MQLTNKINGSQLSIREHAQQLAKQVAPVDHGVELAANAPHRTTFFGRRLLAKAKESGVIAAARNWAEGQAKLAELVVSAQVEVARQGLQALTAALGAQAHAGAAVIINEADRQFQQEIASQIVDFTGRYNGLLAHSRSQEDPKLREGLEALLEKTLLKFLDAISEREDQFREVTKKRIQEVLK